MSTGTTNTKDPLYCRKEKSLGLLCSKFIKLYECSGVETVGLDTAALQLGVERRRMYDIVNILESIGVLQRKAKNEYTWKGLDAIPTTLKALTSNQEVHDKFGDADDRNVLKRKESGVSSNAKTNSREKSVDSDKEHRKEKSLALLAQNFIKLFLSCGVDPISLDRAALVLLGDSNDATAKRTKVRRLYDIANVFSSMKLIEKTRDPDGKPAFRWMGTVNESVKRGSSVQLEENSSKRRAFGKEITNIVINSSNFHDKETIQKRGKNVKNELSSEQRKNFPSKGFVFGPFAPPSVTQNCKNHAEKQIQDWDKLSCVNEPQYQNQEISNLFHHYTDAWKSWHVEAQEANHIGGSSGSKIDTTTVE